MKNVSKLFGIIVLLAIVGFAATSCATNTTYGGASGGHGLFTGNGAASTAIEGATEIGSYSVILGIVDAGYTEYAEAVKAAEAAGKEVISVTKWLVFLNKTTAYAR